MMEERSGRGISGLDISQKVFMAIWQREVTRQKLRSGTKSNIKGFLNHIKEKYFKEQFGDFPAVLHGLMGRRSEKSNTSRGNRISTHH